jgi:mono/diheme cytochrome c family protein
MMPRFRSLILLVAVSLCDPRLRAAEPPAPGPFFEAEQPVFGAQVQLTPPPQGETTGGNFVVRGLVIPLGREHALVFDQELLRVAGLWKVPAGQPPITLTTMAPISYANPRRKAGGEHPQPTGRPLLLAGMHPGVAAKIEALFDDPRPAPTPGDEGRGALPAGLARFEGIALAGATALLHYRVGDVAVVEWHEAQTAGAETRLLRHLEVAPHAAPLHFTVGTSGGNAWTLQGAQSAVVEASDAGAIEVSTNSDRFTLGVQRSELVASLAASPTTQRVTLATTVGRASVPEVGKLGATPARPVPPSQTRWTGVVTSEVELDSLQQNGLILDRIATPDENPWRRRVRVADLAFLNADRAAVVTYDGDVWIVDGFADAKLPRVTWRRFASGLHEPLAITAPGGIVQVATKNGVIRLHDRNGDGEADWFENFNDHLLQSQTTRSFPLDMGIGPDGSTYISQGGIVTRSGLISGGEGTAHTGAILKISPDGRSSEVVATGMREPFMTVHPKTGLITATDQQGHFIPSSVSYLVRPGDDFGYLRNEPEKLAPPLAWIPHEQDSSSASEAWILGAGMGPFDGNLVHLSYGTGRLFIITPDLDAPVAQGAVIPLDLKTELPLLHARMHPQGDALYLAGFQIWGTRATTNWALGRLRRGNTPIVTAIAAKSFAEGVVLEFAEPLDPESMASAKVTARGWNYKRSSTYGSGRYTLEGAAGTTPWPVGELVLSRDRKAVLVHLPKLPAMHQLEVRHDFRLAGGAAARGVVYFTIHQPRALEPTTAGFPPVDLSKSHAVVAVAKEEPATPAMGKALSESLGCVACHSADGSTEGKVGPTWRRLFGAKRTFVDGTTEIADELYLREKILDPQQKKMKAGQVEMPSYRGVLSEQQLEAIVLYIRSLAGRPASADADR